MPSRSQRDSQAESSEPTFSLHERALDNVAFMRGVMERSSHFTAVPGWGGLAMGITALVAAVVAAGQRDPRVWMAVWLAEAALAAVIAIVTTAHKARKNGVPLGVGPARRFALCLMPAIVAGAALTVAATQAEAWALLPAIWLLLYGTGVCAAGAVSSPPVVSLLGIALIVGGVTAACSPAAWGNWYLAAFFGFGHVAAGIVIVRNHGG